jgi:cell division protein ZapA (FtsZ GTPase activity inhibitor)
VLSDTEQLNLFPGAHRPITVHVAGRSLQMTVESQAEEDVIREAERAVAEKLNMFTSNYRSINRQDLLCMVLLQFATEAVDARKEPHMADDTVAQRLNALSERIAEALV